MEGSINPLTEWRLEKAKSTLSGAQKNLEIEEYEICLNRCYYSVLYAMQAVNSTVGYDSRKHSGVIAHFRSKFIKSGLLPIELSDIITKTSKYREKADYEDMYSATRDIAEEQVKNAKAFVEAVNLYLEAMRC